MIGFLTLLLRVATIIGGYLREQNLMDAGAKRQVAKDMAALVTRLGIGREIVAHVEALPDDDIDAELRGDT